MTATADTIRLVGHATGALWSADGIRIGFGSGSDWYTILIPPGAELALAVEGERKCIGYRDAAGYHRCPDSSPATWVAHCDGCRRRNSLKRSSIVLGGLGAESIRPSSGPSHVVYLASYAPGYSANGNSYLKVGTAGVGRVYERLAEQGAREALVIGAGSQLDVERLEAAICQLDHRRGVDGVKAAPNRRRIRDRLNQSQHLEAWAITPDRELMVEELWRRLHELHRRLPYFASIFLPPEKIVEMELPELPPISPACKLLKASGLILRGRVRGIYGLYLIIDGDTGEQVALNTRSLIGYSLRVPADDEWGQDQLALTLSY